MLNFRQSKNNDQFQNIMQITNQVSQMNFGMKIKQTQKNTINYIFLLPWIFNFSGASPCFLACLFRVFQNRNICFSLYMISAKVFVRAKFPN